MADTAFQIQYRKEWIAGYEVRISALSAVATQEAVIKGNQAEFLVADSGPNALATTRGVNGLIPARADNLGQFIATLVEKHDLVRRTSFNIFASQGDGRRIMQQTTAGTINRAIDLDIIAELANATNNNGAATTASLAMVTNVLATLGNNAVNTEEEDKMFFLCSPKFRAYLMQTKEFVSVDYVDIKPLVGPARRVMRWAGFNWIVSPLLTGIGTAAELCYAFHSDAIGHAMNTGGIMATTNYVEEQDYSWARASVYVGTKILQQSGIVQISHIGN